MKEVWIVFHPKSFSDEQEVVEVFDSEEKAKQYIKNTAWHGYQLTYEKWSVK